MKFRAKQDRVAGNNDWGLISLFQPPLKWYLLPKQCP